jgi:hypothetical protein
VPLQRTWLPGSSDTLASFTPVPGCIRSRIRAYRNSFLVSVKGKSALAQRSCPRRPLFHNGGRPFRAQVEGGCTRAFPAGHPAGVPVPSVAVLCEAPPGALRKVKVSMRGSPTSRGMKSMSSSPKQTTSGTFLTSRFPAWVCHGRSRPAVWDSVPHGMCHGRSGAHRVPASVPHPFPLPLGEGGVRVPVRAGPTLALSTQSRGDAEEGGAGKGLRPLVCALPAGGWPFHPKWSPVSHLLATKPSRTPMVKSPSKMVR